MTDERIYETTKTQTYRVHFRDGNNQAFYRQVTANSEAQAVAIAMTQDRAAGGGFITYDRCTV